MAAEIMVRLATMRDAEELAANLRPEDADELRAATGSEPLPVLIEGLEESVECCALVLGGELAAIWGVVPAVPHWGIGVGWLLTTPVVERRPVAFWRACLRLLPDLLDRWPVLINAIDARHEKALRWARRLGFVVDEPRPFGAAGLPFHNFRVTREGFACAHP